jgi:hypothetical protein
VDLKDQKLPFDVLSLIPELGMLLLPKKNTTRQARV